MNSHPMRVVHLLRKLNPEEWGGTETAIERLCDGLRAHHVTPIIYCPRLHQASLTDPLQNSGYRVQRFKAFVPVLGLSSERKRQLVAVGGNLMSFDLIAALLREEPFDVMHTHALGRIGAIARTIAQRRRIPFVVSIHGGVLDLPTQLKSSMNAPEGKGWEWGRLFGLLLQSHRLFHDADAIITCNEREASLIRERHPDRRVLVQPHGVPVESFQTDQRSAALKAFPQIAGRKVLLNVGRIDPVKNQGWLLEQAPELVRRHPEILIVLAGPCTDEPYGAQVQKFIRENGLDSFVLMTGGLPSNDSRLIGLMQSAAALVLSSISETFGLILLESWAAGTVVLASATSGARALVRPGENGWLFDLDNPAEFQRMVSQTLSDPDRCREMAAAGKHLVERDYSVIALAGRIKQVYGELVQEKERRCVT